MEEMQLLLKMLHVEKEEIPWIFPFSHPQPLSFCVHGNLQTRRKEISEW